MSKKRVRSVAMCVFRNDDSLFLSEARDTVTGEVFYRPIGGAIEFGESAVEAVKRECMEELGVEVHDVRFLGVIENVHRFEGKDKHEIALVHEGEFVDESVYEQESLPRIDRKQHVQRALWVDIDEFRAARKPLYPKGLLALLSRPPET